MVSYDVNVSNRKTVLSTGTKTKILGTSNYLYTMLIYDDKGRVIQVQSTNITGGTDVLTTQYGWQRLPLIVVQKQQKADANAQTITTVAKNSYDELGRLIKTEKKLSHSQLNGGSMSAYATTSQVEYDALGQTKTKKLGTAPLEAEQYDYNIRGWLLGANRDYVKDAATANYFGFDLGYDKNGVLGSYTPQYNGNIAGAVWKSKGDGEKRKYDFTYDAVNRITGADFNQYTSSAFNKTAGVDFSVSGLAYDANGNIYAMTQYGLKINTSPLIDQLTYTYQTYSNKLSQVTDAVNDNTSMLGDFKYDPATKGSTDYNYDGNGNLSLDNNKKISGITYNYLNLPSVITVTGKGTITYTYDAAGNKLKKVTVDNTVSPAKTTTTLYIGGAVYQNDTLQFIAHEEGRIRPVRDGSGNVTSFTYDYFLKDHLGNIRLVLTEEQKMDMYPPASMEAAQATTEESLYANLPQSRTGISSIAGYPTDNYTDPNNYVAKTNGNGNKIGPSIILKVMAGDKFNIRVSSWYKKNGATPSSPNSIATDLITSLINSLTGTGGPVHGTITSTDLTNSGVMPTSVNSFLNSQPSPGSTKPKAYLNWMFLDEQFKFAGGSAAQVGDDYILTIITKDATVLNAPKNGYLYVFVSNETPNIDVYFDNLQVTHIRGPILEETHYYPFGLTMAGISSKAANSLDNKTKFNGKELNEDLDLDWYEYGFRNNFDPQLGRFHSVDPLASDYPYYTPYQFAGNQVPNAIDIDGLEPAFFNDLVSWAAQKVATNPNSSTSKAIGAVAGVGKSIEKTITGVGNLVAHPIESGKALLNMNTPEGIANMAIGVADKVNTLQNGTGFEKAALISEAVTDVATIVVGTKGLGAGVKGAETAGVVAEATTSSKSAVSGLNLGKKLASEAQMSEAGVPIAGAGTSTPLRKAGELAKEYGGQASDYAKKSSSSYTAKDGTKFSTHWEENVKTGQRVNIKTKLKDD